MSWICHFLYLEILWWGKCGMKNMKKTWSKTTQIEIFTSLKTWMGIRVKTKKKSNLFTDYFYPTGRWLHGFIVYTIQITLSLSLYPPTDLLYWQIFLFVVINVLSCPVSEKNKIKKDSFEMKISWSACLNTAFLLEKNNLCFQNQYYQQTCKIRQTGCQIPLCIYSLHIDLLSLGQMFSAEVFLNSSSLILIFRVGSFPCCM